jgi:hypothetical protein
MDLNKGAVSKDSATKNLAIKPINVDRTTI